MGIQYETKQEQSRPADSTSNFVVEDPDSSDYSVKSLQYPETLSGNSDEYGKNRVLFYINVQGAGKIAKGGTQDSFPTIELEPYRYITSSGDELKKNATQLDEELNITKPKRRLSRAISLYVPESLTKAYSVDWNMEDGDSMVTGEIWSGILLGGVKLFNKSTREDGTEEIKENALGGLASKVLGGQKYAQKAAGLTPGNSKAQLLFRSVDFGEFTFDYKFAPKTESEAGNVLEIIRTFRHHMLPEFLDSGKFIYIYPSEFEIRYYHGVEENKYLEHHITAVLTNMTINYTPNGQYSTFDNGMPTHISVTLRFKELGTPSKETSPSMRSGA
jgi:hypothetical protein